MQASTCRRAWPKRLPRQPRSDEGVVRTPRAQFGAQPEAAQPAQRFGRSLKRPVDVGAARAPRSDKRARPEGVGEQPACAPAQETDISAARGQVLADHLRISVGRTLSGCITSRHSIYFKDLLIQPTGRATPLLVAAPSAMATWSSSLIGLSPGGTSRWWMCCRWFHKTLPG